MDSCSLVCNFCVLLVLFQLIRVVFPWIYKNIIGPKFLGPKVDVRKMGDWALVTGATEGIGKEYAIALAKKGLNLVLISRSKEKLENVAKEIESIAKVQVKVIDIDFTHDNDIYDKVEKNLTGLEIGVLVNNVGMSYSCPEYFLSIPNKEKFFKDLISCNIYSVLHMCKIVLPGMVERKKGLIINISSMAAKIPNPLLAIYSSTKAFVDKFSEDLGIEYKAQGIVVQSVLPGFVATNMSKIKRATWMAPSPAIFVESALNTLGIASQTTGYFPHAVMKLAIDTIRAVTCSSFANSLVLKQLTNIRSRNLRKTKLN